MIDGERVLAVITARGGSKGLPGKNILEVGDKPLLAWTIEQAQSSRYIDRLILSSNDEQIIAVAKRFGCEVPFLRPSALSRDESLSVDALSHAIGEVPGYELTVLLQPTSPLRLAEDIDICLEHIVRSGAHSCVSVAPVDKSPHWMLTIDEHNRISPLMGWAGFRTRRQDLPASFYPNGAVYIVRTDWFLENMTFIAEGTIAHIMPAERSLDIDGPLDFKLFKCIIED